MPRTGNVRFRLHRPVLGTPLLVLQVEERGTRVTDLGGSGYYDYDEFTRWRDARIEDFPLGRVFK